MANSNAALVAELTAQLASSRAAHLDALEDARRERERASTQTRFAEARAEALAALLQTLRKERKEAALLRRTLDNSDTTTYAGTALSAVADNRILQEESQRLHADLERKHEEEKVVPFPWALRTRNIQQSLGSVTLGKPVSADSDSALHEHTTRIVWIHPREPIAHAGCYVDLTVHDSVRRCCACARR